MRSHYATPDGTLLISICQCALQCDRVFVVNLISSLNLNKYVHAFLFFLSFEVRRKLYSEVGLGSDFGQLINRLLSTSYHAANST